MFLEIGTSIMSEGVGHWAGPDGLKGRTDQSLRVDGEQQKAKREEGSISKGGGGT